MKVKEVINSISKTGERLIEDNNLSAKPEYNSILLFKLEDLRKRTL